METNVKNAVSVLVIALAVFGLAVTAVAPTVEARSGHGEVSVFCDTNGGQAGCGYDYIISDVPG